MDFDTWCKDTESKSPVFRFWPSALKMELDLLLFFSELSEAKTLNRIF